MPLNRTLTYGFDGIFLGIVFYRNKKSTSAFKVTWVNLPLLPPFLVFLLRLAKG